MSLSGHPGAGRRVALTQSPGRLEELSALLESRGYRVVRCPLVETVARTDEKTGTAVAALMALPWVLLTSRSTVEALRELDADFSACRLGAIGPATAEAAAALGGEVAFTAAPNNAEGLARTFLGHPEARGPVGLPRGNRALTTLERELGEAGIATRPLVVYDTITRDGQALEAEPPEAVVLASPSAVEALPERVGRRSRLVTLGSTTSRAVGERGWTCVEAASPSAEAALEALARVLT